MLDRHVGFEDGFPLPGDLEDGVATEVLDDSAMQGLEVLLEERVNPLDLCGDVALGHPSGSSAWNVTPVMLWTSSERGCAVRAQRLDASCSPSSRAARTPGRNTEWILVRPSGRR